MSSWCLVLGAPRVFRAPEGPAAREARASLRSAPRLEARPCPPVPPAPSTPVGPGVLRSGLARCLAIRPGPASAQGCRRQALDPRRGCLCRSHSGAFGYALLQTSSIGGVFRVDFCVVVTNVVNPTAFSLKIKVFGRRLTTFVTETLERRCESRWFDDVCNVGRPLVARPGPAAAHGHRSLALPTRRPGCLKPPSPLRACACVGLKPSSPLWAPAEP